jgi:hypothetical protein
VLDLLTEIVSDPSRTPEGLTPVPAYSPRSSDADTRRSGVVQL